MRNDDVRELLETLKRIECLLVRLNERKIPEEFQVELTIEEAAERWGCTVVEMVKKIESGEVACNTIP